MDGEEATERKKKQGVRDRDVLGGTPSEVCIPGKISHGVFNSWTWAKDLGVMKILPDGKRKKGKKKKRAEGETRKGRGVLFCGLGKRKRKGPLLKPSAG